MLAPLNPSFCIGLELKIEGNPIALLNASIWEPVAASTPGQIWLECPCVLESAFGLPDGPFSLEGQRGATRLRAEGVWLKDIEQVISSPGGARAIVRLDYVEELEVIECGTQAEPGTVEYFLTPCRGLYPTVSFKSNHNAQFTRHVTHEVSFDHTLLGPIVFDMRNSVVETAPELPSDTSFLYAKFKRTPLPDLDLKVLDEKMQEILTVAGFAARYPVRVWGRQLASTTEVHRTYFGALQTSIPDWEQPARYELIRKSELPRFLAFACPVIDAMPVAQRDAICRAMLVARSENGTTEDQFRATFAAFEALYKVFADKGSQKMSKPERRRNKLVVKAIRDTLLKLRENDTQIDVPSILAKLQAPGARAGQQFESFVNKFQVPVADLWPVYAGDQAVLNLYTIRNYFAHGSLFDLAQLSAVGGALLQLRLLLERCVLSVLGWPINQSAVSLDMVADFVSSDYMNGLKKALPPRKSR